MSVTSHSILRYLTRADPTLGEAIVTNLQKMATEAKPFVGDDARWHSETGLVLIVEDGVVVTILDREQSAKYRGRNLADGGKAE